MKIKQLSVFLENRSGRLADTTSTLGNADINIRAISLADSSDFGILRLIVDNSELAAQVLKDNGFIAGRTDVIAIVIPDRTGELGKLLGALENAGLNIEYMYALTQNHMKDAVMIFRFNDVDNAIKTVLSEGFTILNEEKIQEL